MKLPSFSAEPYLIDPLWLVVHVWPLVYYYDCFRTCWLIAQCTMWPIYVVVFSPLLMTICASSKLLKRPTLNPRPMNRSPVRRGLACLPWLLERGRWAQKPLFVSRGPRPLDLWCHWVYQNKAIALCLGWTKIKYYVCNYGCFSTFLSTNDASFKL